MVNSYKCFSGGKCNHLPGQAIQEECLTLKVAEPSCISCSTLLTTFPTAEAVAFLSETSHTFHCAEIKFTGEIKAAQRSLAISILTTEYRRCCSTNRIMCYIPYNPYFPLGRTQGREHATLHQLLF